MNKERLEPIYQFLKSNRKYPDQHRFGTLNALLNPNLSQAEQVKVFLHHYVNTQRQPSLDGTASFWRDLEVNEGRLKSFHGFMKVFGITKSETPYSNLYSVLSGTKNNGWGPKTAALLTKAIYQLHHRNDKLMRLWNEVPEFNDELDELFVPVDAVIRSIFYEYLGVKNSNYYDKINSVIHEHYRGKQIEVWDDLWFWGFITQHGGGIIRDHTWNESKYYSLISLKKSPKVDKEVNDRAKEFLGILDLVKTID